MFSHNEPKVTLNNEFVEFFMRATSVSCWSKGVFALITIFMCFSNNFCCLLSARLFLMSFIDSVEKGWNFLIFTLKLWKTILSNILLFMKTKNNLFFSLLEHFFWVFSVCFDFFLSRCFFFSNLPSFW